jgi:hypothetical protein
VARYASDAARDAEFDDWHARSTGTDVTLLMDGRFVSQRVSAADLAEVIGVLKRWPVDWHELCLATAELPQPKPWHELYTVDPQRAADLALEISARCPGPDCDGPACADCAHATQKALNVAAALELSRLLALSGA